MNSTLGPWTTGDPINEFKDGHVWRVPIWAENGPEGGKIAAEATAPTREMARANARLICDAHEMYTKAQNKPTPADRGTARAIIAHMEQPQLLSCEDYDPDAPMGENYETGESMPLSLITREQGGHVRTLNLPSFQTYEARRRKMLTGAL